MSCSAQCTTEGIAKTRNWAETDGILHGRHVAENNREFVTFEAGNRIALAHLPKQVLRDHAQGFVGNMVAIDADHTRRNPVILTTITPT